MQHQRRLLAVLVAAAAAAAPASALLRGPEACVSFSRSAAGTCVIKTNCRGIETEGFEFAVDCWNGPVDHVRHSFGFGGFEPEEEFDTSIPCKRCDAVGYDPAEAAAAAEEEAEEVQVPQATSRSHAEAGRTVLVAGEPPKSLAPTSLAKYGPGGCVSTWRDKKTSHCVVMTQCKDEDMSSYEYGLVCEDNKGNEMQHLFGKNSFNKDEIFDTLIVCDKCSGTEQAANLRGTLAMNLKVLADDVKGLKSTLTNVTKAVDKLKDKVFGSTTTTTATDAATDTATASSVDETASANETASSFLHHHRQLRAKAKVYRRHQAHHHDALVARRARQHGPHAARQVHSHRTAPTPPPKASHRPARHWKHSTRKLAAEDEDLAEETDQEDALKDE